MNLPDTILVQDLQAVHPEYDSGRLAHCKALYHGGRIFAESLDEFLVKRKIEEKDRSHYELRKRRSFYVPYSAGLLDWIAAAAFQDGVEVRVVSGDQEAVDYYESLNADADGRGTPITAIASRALLAAMTYGRAYVFPDFRHPMSIATQPKTKDARLVLLDPVAIDDWEQDEEGFLEWSRMHVMERTRDEAAHYKKAQDERHLWTFFDEKNITVYELLKKAGQRQEKIAKRIESRAHGLGLCPVFDVRSPENIWVMDRIFEVAVALFNREASLTWALDMSAYATLVLTLDQTQINQIVATELAALRLRVGESANYIAPPGGIYEPLFKDADRLKANLYEVVRTLGIDAAKVPQAGRMSGETISQMRAPLDVLLESFSQPVLEAIARLIDAVRRKRGDDDVEVEIVMGDDAEVSTDETEREMEAERGRDEGDSDGSEAESTDGGSEDGAAGESIGYRKALVAEDRI